MHYLAVRRVDPKTQGFYSSFRYTLYLAYMLWMIRLLVLESALSEQGWPRLGLPSRQEFVEEKGAVAVAERIQAVRREYLCEGSYTPASSILSQLAFGQKQSRHHSAEANIYWSDDRQTVFYDGKGVAMAKVRVMCQALTDELEGLLQELLFGQSVQPLLLPLLVDSMGVTQRFRQKGYSFIDHPDNARWKVGYEFLWERSLKAGQKLVQSSGSGSDDSSSSKNSGSGSGSDNGSDSGSDDCDSSGSGSGNREWITQAGNAYLAQEKQFLQKLLVAIHIQGGQPARGPEIGTITIRNSATSNRNIFVINGRVAVVTIYDKCQKRRGQVEYVFRCFPDRLS